MILEPLFLGFSILLEAGAVQFSTTNIDEWPIPASWKTPTQLLGIIYPFTAFVYLILGFLQGPPLLFLAVLLWSLGPLTAIICRRKNRITSVWKSGDAILSLVALILIGYVRFCP